MYLQLFRCKLGLRKINAPQYPHPAARKLRIDTLEVDDGEAAPQEVRDVQRWVVSILPARAINGTGGGQVETKKLVLVR